jgi:hypothetical protein
LKQENAEYAYEEHEKNSVDFLMVDISNDGEVYRNTLCKWHSILTPKATVMLEGGCEERDNVEWMVKYNKIPIKLALEDEVINELYNLYVVGDFPSITVAVKKG